MQRPIIFTNRSMDIYGVLHQPPRRKGKSVPVVVLCHGFQGTKVESHRIFVKMARNLVSRGMAVLRFDFRGAGDSEGNFEDVTISGEISDVVKALDWIETQSVQEGFDTGKIGLLGLSLGGLVSACAAAKDKRVKALALWGAVSNLKASQARMLEQRGQWIHDLPNGMVDYGGNVLGKPFFAEFEKIDPLKKIENFTRPVCIVHGTEDITEPATNAKAYQQALGKGHPLNRMVLVKGADHTFSSVAWERQVLKATGEFFEAVLA
jgi:uncharacterized protein